MSSNYLAPPTTAESNMKQIKVLKKDDPAGQTTSMKPRENSTAVFDKIKVSNTIDAWVAGWRAKKTEESRLAQNFVLSVRNNRANELRTSRSYPNKPAATDAGPISESDEASRYSGDQDSGDDIAAPSIRT